VLGRSVFLSGGGGGEGRLLLVFQVWSLGESLEEVIMETCSSWGMLWGLKSF